MDSNDILQVTGVAVALIICIIWIVKRIRRRYATDDGCGEKDSCQGCELSELCSKKKEKKEPGCSCGCK